MRQKTHFTHKLVATPQVENRKSTQPLTPLQERILEWDREYLRQTKRLATAMARAKRRISRHNIH